LKKIFVAGIGFLLLSNLSTEKVNATVYTHNLVYTHTDNTQSATLEGRITFEDSDDAHDDDFVGQFGPALIDRDFITNVTFTYTPSGGNPITINNLQVTGIKFVHNNGSNTDYDGNPSLYSQFSTLQFYSTGGAFNLNMNDGTAFSQQAGGQDDFLLSSTTYHSPGPLPVLGLLTAFSSMKKLKSKYKNQTKSIIN